MDANAAVDTEGRTFTVRPTAEADLPQVLDVTEVVAGEGRWIATEAGFDREARAERIRRSIAAETTASFVAVTPAPPGGAVGERVIGNLGTERYGYGVAELGMLVAPEWRGRGVGSALLRAAIDWARQAGAHKVSLQCWPHNVAAIALYEKFGFVREGYLTRHYRRANGELWDAVIMGLLLD